MSRPAKATATDGCKGTKEKVTSSKLFHGISYFKETCPWKDLRINQSEGLVLHSRKLRPREAPHFP